jgi:DNA polymerase-3 subunit delta
MARKQRDNTVQSLERSLTPAQLLPVYLLVGEEAFLRHRARSLIHDTVVSAGGSVSVFSGDDTLEEVLTELKGDSLFTTLRMVEVMGADAFLRTHGDALVRYLERPSASGVLVLDVEKVDRRTKLPAAVRDVGMIVDCPKVYEDRLPGWVRGEATRRGVKMSATAISALIDEVGDNLFALASELDKLVTYVGDTGNVDVRHVAELTGHTRSWAVWALTDALGSRDVAAALRVLEDLLREGESPEKLVGTLNWQIDRLWRGKVLVERGGTQHDVMRELHVAPRFAGTLMEQIGRFTVDDLARISRRLLRADVELKSTPTDTRTALERFLVEACTPANVR